MAGIAGYRRMSTEQWKSIQVILHCVRGYLPSADRMAILASGAELAAMDVGVAIRALLTDLGEDFADMTLAAGHVLVQPSQRELGFGVVVELRLSANRFPAHARMAAFARYIQRTMGICGPLWLSPLRAHKSSSR